MLSPVSCASCSRMCRVGLGVAANAALSVSSCLALIVVRGPRRFAPAAAVPPPPVVDCPLPSAVPPPTSSHLSLPRFSPTLLLLVRPALGRDPLVSSPQLDIESMLQSSLHASRSLPTTSLPLPATTTPRGPLHSGGVMTSIFNAPLCVQSLLDGDVQAPRTPPPHKLPGGSGNAGERCDGEPSVKHWSGAVVDGLLTSRSDSPSSSLSCSRLLSTSASVMSA